jgi:hypothetical protein
MLGDIFNIISAARLVKEILNTHKDMYETIQELISVEIRHRLCVVTAKAF